MNSPPLSPRRRGSSDSPPWCSPSSPPRSSPTPPPRVHPHHPRNKQFPIAAQGWPMQLASKLTGGTPYRARIADWLPPKPHLGIRLISCYQGHLVIKQLTIQLATPKKDPHPVSVRHVCSIHDNPFHALRSHTSRRINRQLRVLPTRRLHPPFHMAHIHSSITLPALGLPIPRVILSSPLNPYS